MTQPRQGGVVSAALAVLLITLIGCTAAPGQTAAPTGAAPTSSATSAAESEAPAETEAPAESTEPTFVPGTGDLRWYCCLGTGEDPDLQIPLEQQVAADWSADHPDETMTFEVVTYDAAVNTLSTMIAG